jgi:hypothetical protein
MSNAHDPGPLITMREAAEILCIGRSTLHRCWRDMGLPFFRPLPTMRKWVVPARAVIEYRDQRRQEQK